MSDKAIKGLILVYCRTTSAKISRGEQSLVAMLAVKRLAGVAPEMNHREHTSHTPLPCVNKAVDSGFETQTRHHQKSKTGVSVAP